jgi:hypothetical protein
MAKRRVADVLVDTLVAAGVKQVYKAVLSGRGDELVDLAKVNLFR